MRRLLILWHALLMAVIGGALSVYWGILLYFGSGPVIYRYIRVGPIAYRTDILTLCTAILAPTFLFSVFYLLRCISRDGRRFSRWQGLPFVSNWYAVQATILLVLVIAFGPSLSNLVSTDWRAAFARLTQSSGTPTPPSDEDLNYPELPLKPFNPYGWSIYDMDGNEAPMARFEDKVVFLNFWATWCGFCIFEFPNIQNLYTALKDDPDIVFVLVSPEEPETVHKWVKEQDYTLPFYTIPRENLPSEFALSGLPTTFILAPDGRIAFRHSGFVAWDGEKTRGFLQELARTRTVDAEAGGDDSSVYPAGTGARPV